MLPIDPHNTLLFAFWSPGPLEMLLLAVLALLFYGGDLPDVARSWGKSLSDFRRGLSGIQHDINNVIYNEPEQLEYRPEENWNEDPALSSDDTDALDDNSQPIEAEEGASSPADL